MGVASARSSSSSSMSYSVRSGPKIDGSSAGAAIEGSWVAHNVDWGWTSSSMRLRVAFHQIGLRSNNDLGEDSSDIVGQRSETCAQISYFCPKGLHTKLIGCGMMITFISSDYRKLRNDPSL